MLATLLLLLPVPGLNAQAHRFGLPACDGERRELAIRAEFVVCFDGATKVAPWTACELRAGHFGVSTAQRSRHFQRDLEFDPAHRG